MKNDLDFKLIKPDKSPSDFVEGFLDVTQQVRHDTYQTPGVATENMGITPEGWKAIKRMEKVR